jgi:transposase-like protein
MELHTVACPNPACCNFGRHAAADIVPSSSLGKQGQRERFRCKACGRKFVATCGTFMYRLRISKEAFLGILKRYHGGQTIGDIAACTGVSTDTVLRVFDRAPAYREQVKEALIMEGGVAATTAEEIVQLMEHRARQRSRHRRQRALTRSHEQMGV